ncbi:MAG: Abi family protein [Anaeroplasmataceae bacterium]|nr:Abi family protein [Anaeroplasmataceae bacterium]
MNQDFKSNVEYLEHYNIQFKRTSNVINFLNTNDINRIKRYFPYSKNDWSNINFERIIKKIQFDSFLRNQLFNIVSSIEITFKSILTKSIFMLYNNKYPYNENSFFLDLKYKNEFKKKIENIKQTFRKAPNDVFLQKYFVKSSRVRLPISAIIQKLTFGETIYFFRTFSLDIERIVIKEFNHTSISTFLSNMICVKNIRNACCHLDILNNKKYSTKPNLNYNQKKKIGFSLLNQDLLFLQLYNLKLLCLNKKVWNESLKVLINQITKNTKEKVLKPLQQFGFPKNWIELLR